MFTLFINKHSYHTWIEVEVKLSYRNLPLQIKKGENTIWLIFTPICWLSIYFAILRETVIIGLLDNMTYSFTCLQDCLIWDEMTDIKMNIHTKVHTWTIPKHVSCNIHSCMKIFWVQNTPKVTSDTRKGKKWRYMYTGFVIINLQSKGKFWNVALIALSTST